ncbi:MAG: hypothetical protein R2752_09855 [Vicinamibacterales bacterium]
MRAPLRAFLVALTAVLTVAAGAALVAQGRGRGGMGGMMGGGMMGDEAAQADMALFHELFAARETITRQVTPRADGVETVTESSDPAVAKKIQTHVEAMSARVREARPIHLRDPLFREVFANAEKIALRAEATPNGVRVVETSADPWVVKLIQAHAEVVSAFIRNGQAEAMKNHPLPDRGGD